MWGMWRVRKEALSHDSVAPGAPWMLCKHNSPHYNGNNSMYLSSVNYDFIICIAHVMI